MGWLKDPDQKQPNLFVSSAWFHKPQKPISNLHRKSVDNSASLHDANGILNDIKEKPKIRDLILNALLDVDSETWMRIKNKKWSGLLDQEQLMRIDAIIDLYKALHSCFNDDLADRW